MSAVVEQGWRGLVAGPTRKRAGPVGVLDIGTSKICCYIVRSLPGEEVQLLGRGYQLAEGLPEAVNHLTPQGAVPAA